MKKCPFCAEQIQDEAIKCRYCLSMIPGAAPPSASLIAPPPPPTERRSEGVPEAQARTRRYQSITESDARMLDEGTTVELDANGRISGRAEAILAQKRITIVRPEATTAASSPAPCSVMSIGGEWHVVGCPDAAK